MFRSRQAIEKWSRSFDDQMTFEEAIIAGRGTRQLPAIGPQQLLQGASSGRGRGSHVLRHRELPRPGPSVDLTMNYGNNFHTKAFYMDSDEDEDWC